MISPIKELPKTIKKVILKVENTNEYQINIGDEAIDIKSFYLTSQESPLASSLHGDTFNIIVNGEFLKINNDYINQILVGLLKKIKYRHIVISNIRFINERMINQLLNQPDLEIVEFKNMLITRAMITRLRFLKSLKVVIGQDIEDAAYRELMDRNIDALTIEKIKFKSDLYKELNLSKSSATFLNNLIIERKYEPEELEDFSTFLNVNHKLSDIYLKTDLDLYFVKDIIGAVHHTPHKYLNLIIEDTPVSGQSVDILKQLNDAFGEQNKILIDINKTYIDIPTYKEYLDALNTLKTKPLPASLTPLETIYKVYELVLNSGVNESIKHLLYYNCLRYAGIKNISLLAEKVVMLYIEDPFYKYSGLVISDVSEVSSFTSNKFLLTPANYGNAASPVFTFLKSETHQQMKDYLQNTCFENIMDITKHMEEVFVDDYNFKHINGTGKDVVFIKDTLEQIYVQNRTNEFDKKTFFNVFCNVKQKEGYDHPTIIEQIKELVAKSAV